MKQEVGTYEELEELVRPIVNSHKYVIEVQELPDNTGFKVQWQEHKTYTALDGKVFPEEIWFNEAGEMLQVQDISPEHCRNILRMILRNERELNDSYKNLTNHLIDISQQGGLINIDHEETLPTLH
jgi:hypothetical protein